MFIKINHYGKYLSPKLSLKIKLIFHNGLYEGLKSYLNGPWVVRVINLSFTDLH